jgi:hypothetical protein
MGMGFVNTTDTTNTAIVAAIAAPASNLRREISTFATVPFYQQ